MLVGLTYDLREDYLKLGYSQTQTAEFDSIETIDAIDKALKELGYETCRIGNIFQLTKELGAGKKWDIVFNICEGLNGYGRESQVPCVLDAYNIPYTFSDPMTLALSLHKANTKLIVRAAGVNTPDFLVINKEADICKINLEYPLFIKPLSEGTGKGVSNKSLIKNNIELEKNSLELLREFSQPVLVERFLPGREFTVGLVGSGENSRAVGTMEILITEKGEKDVYGIHNKENWKGLVEYALVKGDIADECGNIAVNAWNALNCRDAGRIDLRIDDKGKISFIEVNPLAGLRPHYSDLPILCEKAGMPYNELIKEIMDSAKQRIV